MYMRLLILLLISANLSAQVTITPGALFHISGNEQVTFYNISLVNNGTFTAGNSTITFAGPANSTISGSQPVQFYRLEMNKLGGNTLVLQRNISVSDRILFTQGFISLGNSDVDLGTTGFLQNENENSRFTGNGSGAVIFTTTLNAPASANPANLGAIISSAQNLGSVTIRRGHDVQTNASGNGNSIRRHYDILPANTSNLNATLRMQYFDGELNSLDENALVFFKNDDGTNWVPQGFSARNTASNWVEKTGINTFRSWTLSAAGNALPMIFKLFNVECFGAHVKVSWATTYEQNSSRFDIQKSTDGIQWATISSASAFGTSTGGYYTYTDQYAVPDNYYRIAAVDKDGKTIYTSVLRSSCGSKEVFKLWPNPVQRTLFVNIVADASTTATIKFFDVKGVLVKEQRSIIQRGNNQLNIDLANLPQGMYAVQAEWNNAQSKNTMQIIKQ
jgi:hypothetical protein